MRLYVDRNRIRVEVDISDASIEVRIKNALIIENWSQYNMYMQFIRDCLEYCDKVRNDSTAFYDQQIPFVTTMHIGVLLFRNDWRYDDPQLQLYRNQNVDLLTGYTQMREFLENVTDYVNNYGVGKGFLTK